MLITSSIPHVTRDVVDASTIGEPIGGGVARRLGLTSGLLVLVALHVSVAIAASEIPRPKQASDLSTSSVAIAFSPNGHAEALVIDVITSAHEQIDMLAYSFTSAPITEALLKARKRGVRVRLVVDRRNNLVDDRSGKARAALQALAHAGVDVRTSDAYAIHHDKVIVADRRHVQTGSFNYSAAAQSRNSENVLVLWDRPDVAEQYLRHFVRNQQGAQALVGRY